MRNSVEFIVHGKYALFTDPVTKIGGEKFTYQIPTYQALKGIVESIYWKPTVIWYIDEVRVMNAIQTEVKGLRPTKHHESSNELAYYTYLRNPSYQVRAHFEFNEHRTDLEHDRNENKHHNVAKRSVERGGRRDIYLGSRECQGYVEACEFSSGESYYDEYGEINFGSMFHGFNYPDETGRNELEARICIPVMKNGVIQFDRPEDCLTVRSIKEQELKAFMLGKNLKSVEEEYSEMFQGEVNK
jgi:CRISPR-associated protein Cas5d